MLFPPAKGWLYTEPEEELYSVTGEIKPITKISVSTSDINNIPGSVNNPMAYYTAPSQLLWFSYSTKYPYLWNTKSGKKTIFDPCPDGWRVPAGKDGISTPWEDSGLEQVFYEERYGGGFAGRSDIYYPAAGYRHGGTGELSGSLGQVVMLRAGNLGRDMKCRNMCLYWTERIHGKGESVIWDEATAGAVRCVKE